MSEKEFEPCTLQDATHVEMGGKVHLLGGNKVGLQPYCGVWRGILWRKKDVFIPEDSFPILGIKPLREKKSEPIEFEAVFAKYDGKWHTMYNLDDGLSYQNCKKARFKCVQICVQILEEKE